MPSKPEIHSGQTLAWPSQTILGSLFPTVRFFAMALAPLPLLSPQSLESESLLRWSWRVGGHYANFQPLCIIHWSVTGPPMVWPETSLCLRTNQSALSRFSVHLCVTWSLLRKTQAVPQYGALVGAASRGLLPDEHFMWASTTSHSAQGVS